MAYTELANMSIDEFFLIVECANKINASREAEIKRSSNGK